MAESDEDPQAPVERRQAARALLQRPLTVKEHDPDLFRLVRRHEAELDRWFTQRLGYRLHVSADVARLHKTTYLPGDRPLRTANGRPFHQLEYVYLALILASTAAGPAVISLGDLVEHVRSAAVDADVTLDDRPADRRAFVGALQWMIGQGLAEELHATVEAYAGDAEADAVLRIRPERIALLPLPALVSAESVDGLLAGADRRVRTRQWMRARLVEDPVLYRSDLTDEEWAELRRRLGDEERQLHEMFGLVVESRAEGVAAIDPAGTLADQRFPTGGTVGHAALLLIEALRPGPGVSKDALADALPSSTRGAYADASASVVPMVKIVRYLTDLAEGNARWSKDLRANPERLTRQVIDLLVDLRLAERVAEPADDRGVPAPSRGSADEQVEKEADEDAVAAGVAEKDGVRLLPAAGRFLAVDSAPAAARRTEDAQAALW